MFEPNLCPHPRHEGQNHLSQLQHLGKIRTPGYPFWVKLVSPAYIIWG